MEHQQSRFHASKPAQILTDLTLRMPPSAHSAYYYDTIGNVSTSHFRQGSTPAQQAKSSKVRTSSRAVEGALELRPRYPLLGGWNYTFTVGWDMPLGDVLKVDGEKQVLGVPFLTGWKDLLVDDAELKIILPEGARLVVGEKSMIRMLMVAMSRSSPPSPLTASPIRLTRRTSTRRDDTL